MPNDHHPSKIMQGLAPTLDEMPSIPTHAGLTGVREWKSFDLEAALNAMNRVINHWRGRPLELNETAAGRIPGGGTFTARVTSGEAGSIATLIVEHQPTRWGCSSSETRIMQPTGEVPALHVVTVECDEHDADSELTNVAAVIARQSSLKIFGVDPFRVGNSTERTVSRLVEMLTSVERDVPIVLLSGKSRAHQASELVARMAGTALVATIDGDASWALSKSLGPTMGCYAGAVRVYAASNRGDHSIENPIWVSRRIAQVGWSEVAREIVGTVLQGAQAARRPRLEMELQREAAKAGLAAAARELERLRAELIETRIATRGMGSTDDELNAIFDAQNETIARLEENLDDALERNLDLEQQLADSVATRESLELALSYREWTRSDAEGSGAVVIIDETVDAAIERMADPTGALVCTESALRAWRGARYPDPTRMLDALRRLESAAIQWRAQNAEIGGRLGEWIQNTTGLRYAGSDQELERRGLAMFEFEGRAISRIPHIKVDDAKHSNQVGRIYFGIDSGQRRWIVDHVGQKLYGR